MSQAFRCDLCGDCVDSADNAKSEREIAKVSANISGTVADIYIKLGAAVAHVCDVCFNEIKRKAKQWVIANIEDVEP
jgi:hypothetical protein